MTSIIAGILLLCVLIVIHELGHFLVAKALGVKVLTFSVGFGPKILKWTRNGTEYCLSAIPLGGYVKMVGDSPTDELTDEEKKVSFLYQPIWKKSAIALAGPMFNLILPIILFAAIFIGTEPFYKSIVGATIPGDPASQAGLIAGDEIVEVDGVKVADFDQVIKSISSKPDQKIVLKVDRLVNGKKTSTLITVNSTAMPDPNPVNVGEFVGRIGIMPAVKRAKIAISDSTSPAALAGLKTFDEVVSVDSVPVHSFDELSAILTGMKKKSFAVSVKRAEKDKPEGSVVDVTVSAKEFKVMLAVDEEIKRFAVDATDLTPKYLQTIEATKKNIQDSAVLLKGMYGIAFADATIAGVKEHSSAEKVGLAPGDRIVSVNGTPVESWFQIQKILSASPDAVQVLGIVGNGMGRVAALRMQMEKEEGSAFKGPAHKVLGAQTGEIYKEGAKGTRELGLVAAISKGVEKTYDLIKLTLKSLLLLVTFSVPISQIGGPIMIFDVAGQAASQGYEYYIFVMSLVSVNLGLMNLLPIPVLDGGHLMMFFVEFVTRKPLTVKTRQIATQLGMAFVLALMFLAVFNDIARLVS